MSASKKMRTYDTFIFNEGNHTALRCVPCGDVTDRSSLFQLSVSPLNEETETKKQFHICRTCLENQFSFIHKNEEASSSEEKRLMYENEENHFSLSKNSFRLADYFPDRKSKYR